MLIATYAYPTTASAGPGESGGTNGSATAAVVSGNPPQVSAELTMNHAAGLDNASWVASFGGFALPALPPDAVIQGIYGVVTVSYVAGPEYPSAYAIPSASFGTTGITMTAGGSFQTTQFTTGNLGTSPSIITGGSADVRLYATNGGNMGSSLNLTFLAYQIQYESAVAVVIPHGVNCNAYANGSALAPSFPPGNGLLLGDLTPANNWAHANNIHGALAQETQVSAIQLLEQLGKLLNSAWVYSGDTLNLIPWDEVSAAGWGAIYVATTASGPVFDLTDQNYVAGEGPVLAERDSHINCDNVVSIEYKNRAIDYTSSSVCASDQMAITLFGTRKGGTLDSSPVSVGIAKGAQSFPAVHDPAVAQATASILVKVSAADPNVYRGKLKAEMFWMEAMTFVTLSDGPLGLNKVPARFRSFKENADKTWSYEAEEFIYGLHHPDIQTPMQSTGTLISNNVDPGLVNAPIIFEPTQAMLGAGAQAQIWFVVSGADPNYGGCVCFVSYDGGASYPAMLGTVSPCTMGTLLADYPVGSDPDTTDALSVDLTESNGSLATQSQATADAFLDPCYVASASGYEIVCPTAAAPTALNEYSLTGYIRRGVDGTAIADHPSSSQFAVLSSAVLKVNIDPQWYGKTLWFKFAAVNLQGGQQNSLASCTPYSFTPVGISGEQLFQVNGA